MSLGKKKSGFQITSVTSDYGKEGPPGGDAKGPSARLADEPSPVENGSHHPNGGTGPKNGPWAPGSPGLAPLLPGPAGCVSGSRFRVVKLDHGLGEPYKRGRWTCRDFYEQEMDHHLVGRLADSARQPQSLDSRLEVASLLAKPSSPFSPPMPRQGGPCLQSLLVLPGAAASAHQARSLGGGLPVLRPGRTLPSAASVQSPRVAAETRPLAPEEGAQEPGDPPQLGTVPLVRVEGHLLPKSVTQLIPREAEERQKVRMGRHVTCRGGVLGTHCSPPLPPNWHRERPEWRDLGWEKAPLRGRPPVSVSPCLQLGLPCSQGVAQLPLPVLLGATLPPQSPSCPWGGMGRCWILLMPSGQKSWSCIRILSGTWQAVAEHPPEGWGTSKVWGCTSPKASPVENLRGGEEEERTLVRGEDKGGGNPFRCP